MQITRSVDYQYSNTIQDCICVTRNSVTITFENFKLIILFCHEITC